MKILELEIHNISMCPIAHLKFNFHDCRNRFPVYVIHCENTKCEVVPLAIQLICSSKYDSVSKLSEIRDKIAGGKVCIVFSVSVDEHKDDLPDNEHSSDSDVPCTSKAALERARRRQERSRIASRDRQVKCTVIVKAIRDFKENPGVIEYSVNGSPSVTCQPHIFHIRFFNCTDLVFPHLADLEHGYYCSGRWLDLIGMEYISKGVGENHFITTFARMYVRREVTLHHKLSHLTTAALMGRNLLDQGRIAQLLYIFQDIRCVFEYITCFEYTVWFMLPTNYGDLTDINQITTSNINFDLMKTKIQLKTPSTSPKFLWTEAEGYVKELFLVAVQLAFGYHCRQNVIFLHNLDQLSDRQSFEYIKTAYARNSGRLRQIEEKDYLQQIINICAQFDLSCFLYYTAGIPFGPVNAFKIFCRIEQQTNFWRISLKTYPHNDTSEENMKILYRRVKKNTKYGVHPTK